MMDISRLKIYIFAAVLIYDAAPLKTELEMEALPGPSEEDGEAEYLEEEIDFGDGKTIIIIIYMICICQDL